MISQRRVIYYTILTTSFFWIFGTIAFFFLQSLEVNIEVKRRRQVEYLSKPNWNIKLGDVHPPPLPSPEKLHLQIDNRIENRTEPIAQLQVDNKKSSPKPRKIIYAVANYENYPPGVKLDGPGDDGEGVTVSSKLKKKESDGFELHQFNLVASDMMSLHRRLPDYRNDA